MISKFLCPVQFCLTSLLCPIHFFRNVDKSNQIEFDLEDISQYCKQQFGDVVLNIA